MTLKGGAPLSLRLQGCASRSGARGVAAARQLATCFACLLLFAPSPVLGQSAPPKPSLDASKGAAPIAPQWLRSLVRLADRVDAGAANAFRLHRLFANGVVLSRSAPAVLGFALPNTTVAVALYNAKGRKVARGATRVRRGGRWRIALRRATTGGPYRLEARCYGKVIILNDVYVGVLYLAAGQSNIIASLGDDVISGDAPWASLAAAEIDAASAQSSPDVRFFQVPQGISGTAKADLPAAGRIYIGNRGGVDPRGSGSWLQLDGATARRKGALGVLLAKRLRARLRVPVGIIQARHLPLTPAQLQLGGCFQCAEGGTSIRNWLPPGVLAGLAGDGLVAPAPAFSRFNAMVAPLAGIGLDGVVWYQGESDAGIQEMPDTYMYYRKLLSALLGAWRDTFSIRRLPYVIVQLAAYTSPYARLNEPKSYGADHWPVVREAQRQVAVEDKYAALAVAFDISGNALALHPADKFNLAARVDAAIRAGYDDGSAAGSGPVFQGAEFADNGSAVLTFGAAAPGLRTGEPEGAGIALDRRNQPVACFELLLGEEWRPVNGTVVGGQRSANQVLLDPAADGGSSDGKSGGGSGKAQGVRYAYSDAPRGCNLYHAGGSRGAPAMPAVPFISGG